MLDPPDSTDTPDPPAPLAPQGEKDSRDTETVRALPAGKLEPLSASFLLVFEGNVSYIFTLPAAGRIILGRGQDSDLLMRAPGVSRQHACITIRDSELRIADLGSHNGTFVNGERVTAPRLLSAGDTITLCDARLILHHQQAAPRQRRMVDLAQFRQQLDEEVDRALRYQRTLAVAVFELGGASVDTQHVASLLAAELRLIDIPTWGSAGRLLIVFPEQSRTEAQETARRLLDRLLPLHAKARAGLSIFPEDGTDAEVLLACARSAALSAQPAKVWHAADLGEVKQVGGTRLIVAEPAMRAVYDLVEQLARSNLPVLICGETGTGKELVARALHLWSARKERALVNVNSATLQESLAESLLFGHTKGAFTGAATSQPGLFGQADGGTIFFDEIGEAPLSIQAKLLRVLENRCIQPVGSTVERRVDVRIVSATNRSLEKEIQQGRFREDLFYRINAGQVCLPPLRARKREIPILARAFLRTACSDIGRAPLQISDSVMEHLIDYSWPGNIRQLKNLMELLASTVREESAELWHLPEFLGGLRTGPRNELPPSAIVPKPAPLQSVSGSQPPPADSSPLRSFQGELRELEQRRISEALAAMNGSVGRTAALLNMPVRTLYHKLKQYKLSAARSNQEPPK